MSADYDFGMSIIKLLTFYEYGQTLTNARWTRTIAVRMRIVQTTTGVILVYVGLDTPETDETAAVRSSFI